MAKKKGPSLSFFTFLKEKFTAIATPISFLLAVGITIPASIDELTATDIRLPVDKTYVINYTISIFSIACWILVFFIILMLLRYMYWIHSQNRDFIKDNIIDKDYSVISGSKQLYRELYQNKNSVIKGATSDIVITGSRSRDVGYLTAVEEKISGSNVNYTRVLFEPVRKIEMKNHLTNIFEMMEGTTIPNGQNRISVGAMAKEQDFPECFICANEKKAVIILPSFKVLRGYDTAIVITDAAVASQYINQVKSMYAACDKKGIVELDQLDVIESSL